MDQIKNTELLSLTITVSFLGLVHRDDTELFRMGEAVSPGVRTFVETGGSDILEQGQQTHYHFIMFLCHLAVFFG